MEDVMINLPTSVARLFTPFALKKAHAGEPHRDGAHDI